MSVGYIIVMAVVAVANLILNLVLAHRAKDAAAQMKDYSHQALADVTVTQQSEGLVVPILYGAGLLAGNLIWWKAGKINSEYYQYRMWLTMCMGDVEVGWQYHLPVTDPVAYRKKSRYNKFSIFVDNVGRFFGDITWLMEAPGLTAHEVSHMSKKVRIHRINSPMCYLQTGTNKQNVSNATPFPPYNMLTETGFSGYPMKAITTLCVGLTDFHPYYMGIHTPAFACWNKLDQGVTTLPEIRLFLTRKFNATEVSDVTLLSYANIYAGGIYTGNNPAVVYYDLLVNSTYGGNVSLSKINMQSFIDAAIYFDSIGYGINFVINAKTEIRNIVLKLQEWTNTFLSKDENDLYVIKILKDTDVNTPVATITDEEIILFPFRRGSWEETINCFIGTYFPVIVGDKARFHFYWGGMLFFDWYENAYRNDYPATVSLKNEANIQLTGSEREKTIDLSCFSNVNAANHRLHQVMKQESFPMVNGSITLNLKYSFVKPGDVIIIDSTEYGMVTPWRVTSVDYKEIDSNQITLSVLQLGSQVTSAISANIDQRGTSVRAVQPAGIETLIFNPFDSISQPMTYTFNDDTKIVVYWSTGQLMTGMLENGVDYTVVGHNKIQLDPLLFSDEIGFNTNGLMSVDVFEDDRIFPAVVIS